MHRYKDGRREGVVFAFIRDGKILLENRNEEANDIFCPNGSIEERDKAPGVDYRETALRREVCEEFGGLITITSCLQAGELYINAINVIFYVYVITGWEGKFPIYTIEGGAPFARLFWVALQDAADIIPYESGAKLMSIIQGIIN